MGRPATNHDHADPTDCATCPLRPRCLAPGETQRLLVVRRGRIAGATMRFKLRPADARRRDARRKVIGAR
jgi:hypothetical protein